MSAGEIVLSVFIYASIASAALLGLYACLLGLLMFPTIQAHVVYLHAGQMTWFKDLDVPEVFGFLHNQVTPFSLVSSDGERLYAWHILPVELYRKHESALLEQPAGLVSDITSGLAFQLLRDDPHAHLVIHMHGAGGTVGSGYRVPNYQALSAGQPGKIHVLTFDYRGFGRSSGKPSENGILLDAIAALDWAMNVAGVPPCRILIFGQSLGTAVSLAAAEYFALQTPPVLFAGVVLVAPFTDVATLLSTYRLVGTIPIISPLAIIPPLFKYLSSFLRDKWMNKDRIAKYVAASEANGQEYRLTLLHAEDDFEIPWHHTPIVFWHAVNATYPTGISYDELEEKKAESRKDRGAAGSIVEWRTEKGVIREEILKTGGHNEIMAYPIITMAVMRIFKAADPSFAGRAG
jgi:abhydrolase domain-containing protein 12